MKNQLFYMPGLVSYKGWSGGAMVLGKLSVPGRPTIRIIVRQGPMALVVGAGGGCLEFLLSSVFSLLSPSLWETARYRLKYCLKRPLNPSNQPTKLCLIVNLSRDNFFFSEAVNNSSYSLLTAKSFPGVSSK